MSTQISSTIVLKVSGKEAENSFSGLSKLVSGLSRELKKLTPGTEEFMKKAAELKEARGYFEKVKNEINSVNSVLDASEGKFKKLFSSFLNFGDIFKSLNAVNLVSGILNLGRSIPSELLKVSDAMADVQKTTGMALTEVKQLWDAFDEMDTRTSKLDRLKIAETAGRLGVKKEEMAEFVREIDKAYVALGDSFQGGLEAVVNGLGKIKGLFEETSGKSYAEAINEVGSALNELAANGTASEGNIADFTLRVGALPDALKPSISAVLGLGAAFEESGVDSQIAASGYSNFMKVAGENLESFAYSMNMPIEKARELFNEKPEEFFLRFSEGMKGIPADETAKIFDSLKLKSLEVQKAVGAAANRTEGFREAIERSAEAMSEATSLTNEFNNKNENAAAIWEKIKNAVSDFFSQTNILNQFEGLIIILGKLMGVTDQVSGGFSTLKNTTMIIIDLVKTLTAGFLGYQAVVVQSALLEGNYTKAKWLGIVADKAQVLIQTTKNGIIGTYNAILVALKIKTDQATVSTAALNAVTKVSPWGALVGLITATVTAYSLLSGEIDDATDSEKRLTEATKEAIAESSKEISTLEKLYKAATDASKGKDAQREAVEKLQRLYPSYFGDMNAEIIMLGKAEAKYKDLREAILASARARAAEKIIQENTEKSLQEEIKLVKERDDKLKERNNLAGKSKKGTYIEEQTTSVVGISVKSRITNQQQANILDSQIAIANKKIAEIQEKAKKENEPILKMIEADKKQAELYEKDKTNQEGSNIPRNNIVSSEEEKKNRAAKNKANEEKREREKDLKNSQSVYEKALKDGGDYNAKMLEAQRAFQDEKNKLLTESLETELTLEKQKYERGVEDLQIKNGKILEEIQSHNAEILKLEQSRDSAKTPEAQANYQKAIDELQKRNQEKTNLITENNKLESQMLLTHEEEKRKIEEKYRLLKYQKDMEALKKGVEDQLYHYEEEIQNINSFEEAKARLSEMEYLKLTETELKNIRTLEDAKKALREDIQRKVLKEQELAIIEQMRALEKLVNDPSFSQEARAKLHEDLETFKKQLQGIQATIQGNAEADEATAEKERRAQKEKIDILGFSVADWEDMFDNLDSTEGKIKGIIMATQALSNAFQRFAQLQQNLNQRELRNFTRNQDQKKLALLKQLNQGLITQEQYHKSIQQIEEETAEKKRKLSERAAKAEKTANLVSAITGTASAVVGALGNKPWTPANIALASIVGALGAVQIATIAATPLPEYAEGGFTGAGAGKPDRTGFKPAGIVHENEYVTPAWMLENPVVADVVDWMESIRTGRSGLPKGYADGGATTVRPEVETAPPIKTENTGDAELKGALSNLSDLLEDLKENGVNAYIIEDAENGKKIQKMINLYENIKNKNARK